MDQAEALNLIEITLNILETHSIQGEPSPGQKFLWKHAPEIPIDWAKFREETLQEYYAGQGSAYDRFYESIREAIKRLGDKHSQLFYNNGQDRGTFIQPMPSLNFLGDILHVVVPQFMPSRDENVRQNYQDIMRKGLLTAAEQYDSGVKPLRGVIIDLQYNYGGDFIPMLRGLSPLLGGGTLGFFCHRHEQLKDELNINYGVNPDFHITADQRNFPLSKTPVALLIGPQTASSAEAVLLCFRKRPDTHIFGLPTSGVSTSNKFFPLIPERGLCLALCSALMLDRAGEGSGLGNRNLDGDSIQPDFPSRDALKDAMSFLQSQVSLRPAAGSMSPRPLIL